MSDNKMYCYQCFMVDHCSLKADAFFWYEVKAKEYCATQNEDWTEGAPKYHYEKVLIV